MMRNSHNRQSGGSAAELLVVAVVATVGAALIVIAFPSLLGSGKVGDAPPATAAVERANEVTAIASLRAIASAEAAYAGANGSYGTLEDLSSGGTIDSRWTGTPIVNGYRFELNVDTSDGKSFCATAARSAGNTGGYSYAVSNRGAIYQLAGDTPPACDSDTGSISSGTILGG